MLVRNVDTGGAVEQFKDRPNTVPLVFNVGDVISKDGKKFIIVQIEKVIEEKEDGEDFIVELVLYVGEAQPAKKEAPPVEKEADPPAEAEPVQKVKRVGIRKGHKKCL